MHSVGAVTCDEAEALTHEVFVRLLGQGHTFRDDARRFEAWLWTIVRNLLIDTVMSNQAARILDRPSNSSIRQLCT
jgi:DNA-directed RNA polymerase specialized sigma24 family protein